MKKIGSFSSLLVAFLAILAPFANSFAGQLHKIQMADTMTVDGKKLLLNGMGAREATIFKVKVYIAGLYLEAPSKSPEAILTSTGIKKLNMHFVHDVDAEKLRDAWKEGIEKTCGDNCAVYESSLKKLTSLMTDMKEGDSMSFTFYPEKAKVEIQAKGAEKSETILGKDFTRALLSIWLGKEPPNSSLKEGLLGLAK